MIKDSALLSVMACRSCCGAPGQVGARTSATLETLLVAAVVYWIAHYRLRLFQERLERRMAQGRPMTASRGRLPARTHARPPGRGDRARPAASRSTSVMLHVLRGVDLDVWQGEAVMLIGRSGSGKTTLLRCINFLEEPTVGTIDVDGRARGSGSARRAARRRTATRSARSDSRAGMLFQEFNLFPHMSVLQNCIEAPTRVKGVGRDEAVATAETLPRQGRPAREAGRVPARVCRAARSSASRLPGHCACSPGC